MDSPGKNTGVGCQALLQGIFPTQESNPCLLRLPALAGGFFTANATWETQWKFSKVQFQISTQLRSQPGPREAGLPVPRVCSELTLGSTVF